VCHLLGYNGPCGKVKMHRETGENREETRDGLRDLRIESFKVIVLFTGVFGYLWLVLVLLPIGGAPAAREAWVGSMLLLLSTVIGYVLKERSSRWASSLLIAGTMPSIVCAMVAYQLPDLAYLFAAPVAFASVLLGPVPTVVTGTVAVLFAGWTSTSRLGLPFFSIQVLLPLAIISLTTVTSWLSERSLYTALDWLWNSHEQVNDLIDDLRDRQGELNRTLRAMDTANAVLVATTDRLAEARRQADEASQAKARFAASVSHELRTPLNIIVGFTEVMYNTPHAYQDIALSPEFLLDLGAVCRNAQHLQALVDDVLDLAQMDAGKFVLLPVETDMAEVVRDAVDTIRNLARVRGLSLVTQIAPDLPRVRVDRVRIKQVLLNLLSNAIRYTEEGTVTVTAMRDGRYVVCSVADTGAGIPEEQQRRIFQEFETIRPVPQPALRGTGLGLAISKRFVREHGGRIWVKSEPGIGSTFGFTVPILDAEDLRATLSARDRSVVPSPEPDTEPVLLVTRSLIAARLFTRHLHGYQCVISIDPLQAVHQIAGLQPRAVLVDAGLGTAAIELLTAGVKKPEQSNVRAYLTKPITRQILRETLRAEGEQIDTILVLDDNEDVLRLISHYLQDDRVRRYHVLTGRNGYEGLEIMRREQPDLVLLDLLMPVMDGYRFLQEMIGLPELRNTPVVVFSGQDALDQVGKVEGWLRLRTSRKIGLNKLIQMIKGLITVEGGANPPEP